MDLDNFSKRQITERKQGDKQGASACFPVSCPALGFPIGKATPADADAGGSKNENSRSLPSLLPVASHRASGSICSGVGGAGHKST
jgi:hypothetical protein